MRVYVKGKPARWGVLWWFYRSGSRKVSKCAHALRLVWGEPFCPPSVFAKVGTCACEANRIFGWSCVRLWEAVASTWNVKATCQVILLFCKIRWRSQEMRVLDFAKLSTGFRQKVIGLMKPRALCRLSQSQFDFHKAYSLCLTRHAVFQRRDAVKPCVQG